jgi:Spy/CpxP family protein refolding chaperone
MHTAAFCAELMIGTLLPEPTTPVSHNEVSMRIVRFGAGLAALVLSAHVWAAQQPTAPPQPDRRPGGMTGASGMAAQMQMMDSLDARFDTLVSRMNGATGNSKVTAMAAVINELVAQRKGMQEHMRQMMESREGMMRMMQEPPAGPRPAPTPRTDSTPADTAGHAGHHPPS